MPKKISQSDIIGQQGINLIEEIVLGMGFLWYPTGGVEAGIDGVIEIRDSETGEVTNCIIQVQSKATQKTQLQAETETSFEYRCAERDIDYWLQGNAPVILIVVKTFTKEAFWVSTKDYFRDPKQRQSRKVLFDKACDRFDVNARFSLMHLAIPRNSGLYLAPRPKKEKLYSNLLQVSRFAEHLYTAYTITEDESKAYSMLQKIGRDLGRVVLHKTSRFIPEELEGFQDALDKHDIDSAEFISFDRTGGTRLFRYGKYPPLRGTLLNLDDRTHVLYTRGSIDFFSTYPGMYVPHPLKFRCESVEGTPKALAQEILALTKMNWNNTQFDCREPITIRAARQVGSILKYLGKNDPLEWHYRFYM